MDKGKGKAAKRNDLSRYFVSRDSSSNPSTHQSTNVRAEQEQEQEVEKETKIFEDSVEAVMEEHVEHDVVVSEDEGTNDCGLEYINFDPGLRIAIDQFAPNIRDDVRFAHLEKGPTQPTKHNFLPNRDNRCFRPQWYKDFDWLEFSVDNGRAYCFYCYLFKRDRMDDKFGHDVFTKVGYDHWKNAVAAFRKHVGGACSIHNISKTSCEDFKNQRASLKSKVITYTKDSLARYETRVDTSLGIVSYLSLQGEPFRGHDESSCSLNKGNFLEMLDWYKKRNRDVKLAFDELCPGNAKMTSPEIQKELAKFCALAVTNSIKEEMDGCLFSVLIDESRDVSIKEQMAMVVRYVNKKGELRNKMSDGWLNDLMVCYIERGIFKNLDLHKIKRDFQKQGRAMPLPGPSRRH